MRIAQLHERRKFQLVEGPLDDPGPGEIQVRVEAVGICGSDMHSFSEGRIGDTVCTYPMVLGHEPTGVVVKTGTGVAGWAPGDRAAFEPAVYCHHCEFCLAGRHNICEHIKFFSTPPDPGFFREFVNLPAQNVLPLAAEIGFREGTLFEPLGGSPALAEVRRPAAVGIRGGFWRGTHWTADDRHVEDVRGGAGVGG